MQISAPALTSEDPELEQWLQERAKRHKNAEKDATSADFRKTTQKVIKPAKKPSSSKTLQRPQQHNPLQRLILKGIIVFALLRRVFLNAIASAESPSAYGAPTSFNYADSIIIILILILFFTKKKHLATILLSIYATLLLIGSLIGFGIDANGKVWMALSAIIIFSTLGFLFKLERDPDPQVLSDEDLERLRQDPVRRF